MRHMTSEEHYNSVIHASGCLEYGADCRGKVEFHTVGSSMKAWPRCEYHAERRLERYEHSIEKYADSVLAPDWFDPSIAGERWDDDY